MNNRISYTGASITLALMAYLWAPSAMPFGGFDDNGGNGLPDCATCHTSLANNGPAHSSHADIANRDCALCHGTGSFDDPPLDNCMRCHGRDEDAGGESISAGLGRGLRQHHVTVGAAACGNCHTDATGPAGVGEDVLPSFYAQALGGAGLDSCDGSEEQFGELLNSLTVSLDNDGDGLTDSADPDCVANQGPSADPNGPYTGSAGSPVTFDGSGSSDPDGTIVAYDWDFGDGGIGTGVDPMYTYASAGTYTVALTVTDDAGATDTQSTTATIAAVPLPPIADANGPYSGAVGSPIGFDGTGSSDPDGTIVSYAWDFGDGGTGSGAMPTYTYAVDGLFTVTLTVTDNDGFTDTDASTATISPAGGNIAPVANANGPYSGTEGVAVQFSSSGSMDADGTIAAYAWDFGDGGSSTAENPTHTYVAAGIYTVTLTVTDNVGASGSDATSATIEAAPVNAPPTADANGPYSGFVGDTIMFDGSGSSDTDGMIVRYDWDFGDGASAADSGATPTHAFTAAGTYTVTLAVTDDMGATDTAMAEAVINERAPVSDGEMQYNSYCASCHGDPWMGPAVDPGLVGVRRVTGARACVIDGSIFGTYVFPGGAPGMEFLQNLVDNGTIDTAKIAEYLNGQPVTGEHYYVTACAGCHGNDGSGGRTGEGVIGDDAEEIREAIYDEDTMLYLACLPNSDIAAMAEFLRERDEDDSDSDSDGDSDYDNDGRHDDEDSDDDNDGVSDDDEIAMGTNPKDSDSDDDGLHDGDERNRGTDPLDADTDDDGKSDGDEVSIYRTDPLVADNVNDNSRSSSGGGGSGDLPLLTLLAVLGLLRVRNHRLQALRAPPRRRGSAR